MYRLSNGAANQFSPGGEKSLTTNWLFCYYYGCLHFYVIKKGERPFTHALVSACLALYRRLDLTIRSAIFYASK